MRISRDQMFMEIAEVVAKRSTCLRNNVGAILVKDNNIISIGYNGVPSGCEHCSLETCRGKGCSIAIHAERNALDRTYFGTINSSIYVTVSPCIDCARRLYSMGVYRVYYRYPYRDLSGLQWLLNHGIKVYKVLPSGEVIEETEEWKGK